jgi:signal transduction histidine kinase
MDLMLLFAQQAAIAIHNSRQFQAVRERLDAVNSAAISLAMMAAWAHDAGNETLGLWTDAESLPKYAPHLNPKACEILERIKTKVAKVANLIPLTPTDIDEKQPVQVGPVLQRILRKYEIEMQQKKIVAEINLDDLPPVLANEWILDEVSNHLVQNAIRAMPDGGKLSISGHIAGTQICVKVMDNGKGISQEVQQRLLTRPVRNQNKGGSGIGLLLARIYLFSCDGDIDFESPNGRGATFVFRLPIANLTDKPEGDSHYV